MKTNEHASTLRNVLTYALSVYNSPTPYQAAKRTGVYKATTRRILDALGFAWTPTMAIGTGCRVHLKAGEIPMDRTIVVSLSRHLTTVVRGVIHDVYDPSRCGTRCVYGYWSND